MELQAHRSFSQHNRNRIPGWKPKLRFRDVFNKVPGKNRVQQCISRCSCPDTRKMISYIHAWISENQSNIEILIHGNSTPFLWRDTRTFEGTSAWNVYLKGIEKERERERERETILRSTNTMTPVSKWLWAQFYRSRPNVPFLLRFLRERKVHRSNLTTWTRRPRQLEKYFSKHGLNLPIRNGIRTVSIVYLSRNEIARLENRFSKKVLPSYWLWNNTATHHALRLYNV